MIADHPPDDDPYVLFAQEAQDTFAATCDDDDGYDVDLRRAWHDDFDLDEDDR